MARHGIDAWPLTARLAESARWSAELEKSLNISRKVAARFAERVQPLRHERDDLAARLEATTKERDELLNQVIALRSSVLLAASRIRAYQSPAYDDRHDFQQARTLDHARAELMEIYNLSADVVNEARDG